MIARFGFRSNVLRVCIRTYSEGASQAQGTGASSTPPPSSQIIPDVPGLSAAVIHPAAQPVGPGVDPNKSGAYKVPEYFCYDSTSFFEAEIEMAKFRLPQPSAIKKWTTWKCYSSFRVEKH